MGNSNTKNKPKYVDSRNLDPWPLIQRVVITPELSTGIVQWFSQLETFMASSGIFPSFSHHFLIIFPSFSHHFPWGSNYVPHIFALPSIKGPIPLLRLQHLAGVAAGGPIVAVMLEAWCFMGIYPEKKTQKLGFIGAKWWIWWISFVNPGILSRLIWIKKIGNGGIPKKYGNIGDEWDFLTIKSFHPIHGQEIIRKMICMICLPVDGMGYPIFRQTEMEATWRRTLLTMELDLGWK